MTAEKPALGRHAFAQATGNSYPDECSICGEREQCDDHLGWESYRDAGGTLRMRREKPVLTAERNAPYRCRACGKVWPGDWYDGPCCDKSDPEALSPPAQGSINAAPWEASALEAAEAERLKRLTDDQHTQAQLADSQLAELRKEKDGAYLERNQVVSALSKCFPAGRARTAIEGWSEDWHGCVYIALPTGQVSWHYHDSQAGLFSHLPFSEKAQWDGHDTAEKYYRLAALLPTSELAELRLAHSNEIVARKQAEQELQQLKAELLAQAERNKNAGK